MRTADSRKLFEANLAGGRVANGYLFVSPDADFVRLVIMEFLAVFLCEKAFPFGRAKGERFLLNPCGSCDGCREFKRDPRLSALFVERAENQKNIGIGMVRQLREYVALAPAFRWRVAAIPETEHLTREAEAALLKILEDPPATAVFLFGVSSPAFLSPAVRSRLVIVRLLPKRREKNGKTVITPPEIFSSSLFEQFSHARVLSADSRRASAFLRDTIAFAEEQLCEKAGRESYDGAELARIGECLRESSRALYLLEHSAANSRLLLENAMVRCGCCFEKSGHMR